MKNEATSKKKSINTGLNFNASFYEQLNGFYVQTSGDKLSAPKIMTFNKSLAD